MKRSNKHFFFYLTAIAFIAAPRFMVSSASAVLVGYWPLDGSYLDASGAGGDGAAIGDPEFSDLVPAALGGGQSIYLDGDDAVDLGNRDILNFSTGDWTIAAWVQRDVGSTGRNIYSNGGDNTPGIRSVLAIDEGGAAGALVLTTDDNVAKVQAISSDNGGPVTVNGEWNHVVGLRSGLEISLYLNGALAGSNTVPEGYDLSGMSMLPSYIGVGASGADADFGEFEKWMTGYIDDVAVWDEALSDVRIADLAAGGPVADSVPGDVDGDEMVTRDDFDILSGNFGLTPATREQGDLVPNREVDLLDFRQWKSNHPFPVAAAGQSVPEPSATLLALLGMGLLAAARRRRLASSAPRPLWESR